MVSIAVLDPVVEIGHAYKAAVRGERVGAVTVVYDRAAGVRLHGSNRYSVIVRIEIVPQQIARMDRKGRIQIRGQAGVQRCDWGSVNAVVGDADIDKDVIRQMVFGRIG